MAVCIVFTYLAVSSIYEKNNARLLSDFYNNQFRNDLENITVTSKNDLIDLRECERNGIKRSYE